MATPIETEPRTDYGDALPRSRKVHLEGQRGIRVPMREIALSGGEPPLRVYDTSGPQGCDVTSGLPKLRDAWIAPRRAATRRSVLVDRRRGREAALGDLVGRRYGDGPLDREEHPRDS